MNDEEALLRRARDGDINAYNEAGNHYGKLSGRILEDLLNETRELDGQSEKRNPLDFAIWKNASPEHLMQ